MLQQLLQSVHASAHVHQSPNMFTVRLKFTLLLMAILMTFISVPLTAAATNIPPSDSLHFTQIESGHYYSIALRKDGTVWTWGRNLLGEIGIQETVTFSETDAPVRLNGLSGINHISTSGSGHSLAVKADGTVWSWGYGSLKAYNDNKIHSILPHQVDGITDAVAVTAGTDFGAAILDDGTVWSWQREIYKADAPQSEFRKPAPVAGIAKAAALFTAGNHIYAIKQDGTVWTWEEPSAYHRSTLATPSKAVQVKGLSDIHSINFGYDTDVFLYVLDKKGKVWRIKGNSKPVAVQPSLTVKEFRATRDYTLFLTQSGDVYSYGRTVTGKQGKVKGLPKITAISAGTYHNQALSETGEVWGWGGNKFLSVGAPSTAYGEMIYTPVKTKDAVDILINGESVYSIFAPRVSSQTIQVPITTIARAIGATVTSDQNNGEGVRSYNLIYQGQAVRFTPYEQSYSIDGRTIDLPEPLSYLNGALSAPYQMLEEGLGVSITWDAELLQLRIDTNNG